MIVTLIKLAGVSAYSWALKLAGSGVSQELVTKITIDPQGNIILVGANPAGYIAKFDSLGNVLWQKTISLTDPQNVCTDLSSNIYITGANSISSGIIKLDSSGTILWTNLVTPDITITSLGRNFTLRSGISITFNNVVVSGVYAFPNPSFFDYIVTGTFDINNGGLLNLSSNVYSNSDLPYSSCSDNTTTYVCGLLTPTPSTALTDYGFVFNINSSGVPVWGSSYKFASSDDIMSSVVYNPYDGYVYSLGFSTGPKLVIFKWDTSGNIIWQRVISSVGSATSKIVCDYSGVYIATLTGNSVFLAKYDTSGSIKWQRTLSSVSALNMDLAINNNTLYIAVDLNVSGSGVDMGLFSLPTNGSGIGNITLPGVTVTYASAANSESAGTADRKSVV